jgi:hypothetical protein
VAERLAGGSAAVSLTGSGLGTGCGSVIVTDSSVTCSIAYKTGCNVGTLSIAVIVSLSREYFIIGVLTNGTYVGHEAGLGTGRLGSYSIVGVTECGNYGSFGNELLTYGTDNTGAMSCLGTGRSGSRNFNLSVSERSDRLLFLSHLATYRALNACGKTFLGTSRSITINCDIALVTGCGNKVESAACATSTGVCSITVSYTSRSGCAAYSPGVHMSIEYPRTRDSVTEGDIVNQNTTALRLSITGEVNAVNSIGSSGNLSYSITDISAIYVVIECHGIGFNVENYTHHNLKPTGELILGVGNVLLVKNKSVPTGSGYDQSAITVIGGRSKNEGLLGNAPISAPSGAAGAAVNELHGEVGIHIGVDLEGVEAY